jgi:hypothetical protein
MRLQVNDEVQFCIQYILRSADDQLRYYASLAALRYPYFSVRSLAFI